MQASKSIFSIRNVSKTDVCMIGTIATINFWVQHMLQHDSVPGRFETVLPQIPLGQGWPGATVAVRSLWFGQ